MFTLFKGTMVGIFEICPTSEWGLPSWPRYKIACDQGEVDLDETAFQSEVDEEKPIPEPIPKKRKTKKDLFDGDQDNEE